MEKRYLCKPDVLITSLGFGAMELLHMDEKEASVLLNGVLDSGINYIDTSPCYGPSEKYIGQAISGRRSEYFLASKCGCNLTGVGPGHIYERKLILKNVENSLKLMKTDYLDVLQLHAPMPANLPGGADDDAVRTLFDLKKEGKIRHVAVSFKNGGPIDELYPAGFGFNCLKEMTDWGVFDVMQTVYGGLVRTSENAIIKAAEKGIGIVARGILKKYTDEYDSKYQAARLDELCSEGESRNSFLIRFALTHPGIATIIIGTSKLGHLSDNIKAAEKGRLSDSVYAEAKKRLDSVGITAEEV